MIEAQAQLPMASLWGLGLTASSDGQFFPAARQGEAMNLVNAPMAATPASRPIPMSQTGSALRNADNPAKVNEAPYVLDGLLMTPAGRRIREQYADPGGFTDHVFAVTSLLGYRFIPRIWDLPSKRLQVFETGRVPNRLIGLTGNKIREDVIVRNWPDILRVAPVAPFRRASCCENSRPIRANTNWPSLSAKSDGSNERSSSSTGCSTPICSAGPTPA